MMMPNSAWINQRCAVLPMVHLCGKFMHDLAESYAQLPGYCLKRPEHTVTGKPSLPSR